MKFTTKEISLFALLLALALIFGRVLAFNYPPGQAVIRINIAFVSALTGIWFGPKKGFMFGVLADLIGFFLLGQSTGLYYFGFTFSAALAGFVPGLTYLGFKRTRLKNIDFSIPIVLVLMALLMVVMFNFDVLIGNITVNGSPIELSDLQIKSFVILQIISITSLILFTVIARIKMKDNNNLYSIDKVIVAVLPIKMLNSFILTPLWLLNLYGSSFVLFVPIRYLLFPAQAIISIVVLYLVLQRFTGIVEEEGIIS